MWMQGQALGCLHCWPEGGLIWHLPCCLRGDINLFLNYKKDRITVSKHWSSYDFHGLWAISDQCSYCLSSMKNRPWYFLWWKATFVADSWYLYTQLSTQRIRNCKNRVKIILILKNEQKCLMAHKFAKITLLCFKMFNKWKSIIGNNYFKNQNFLGPPNNNS